jgi:hypothetical protein
MFDVVDTQDERIAAITAIAMVWMMVRFMI